MIGGEQDRDRDLPLHYQIEREHFRRALQALDLQEVRRAAMYAHEALLWIREERETHLDLIASLTSAVHHLRECVDIYEGREWRAVEELPPKILRSDFRSESDG